MNSYENINSINEKYGFKEIYYGCHSNLSLPELNGIEIYNSQVDGYLNELNGKGWRNEYSKEIRYLEMIIIECD